MRRMNSEACAAHRRYVDSARAGVRSAQLKDHLSDAAQHAPATSGTGAGIVNPVVTPSSGYDWTITLTPLPLCSAEVDIEDADGGLLLDGIGFFPYP